MEEYSDHITIIFKNKPEEIPSIMNLCLEKINIKTENHPIKGPILSKIKWVITEMISNAVKHSGVDECKLKIQIDNDQLVIEKEDKGHPLVLGKKGHEIIWPLKEKPGKTDFNICNNGMDMLKVRINDLNRALFFIEQLQAISMPELLVDTSEHFGLLIITKASDEFTYEYDSESNTNRFRTNFNLKTF